MNDQEKLTLWLGATRYYMGRMSYAVTDFCDLLIKSWGDIPENTRKLIQRDLEKEFELDDEVRRNRDTKRDHAPLGMDCDRKQWERVRELWTGRN